MDVCKTFHRSTIGQEFGEAGGEDQSQLLRTLYTDRLENAIDIADIIHVCAICAVIGDGVNRLNCLPSDGIPEQCVSSRTYT